MRHQSYERSVWRLKRHSRSETKIRRNPQVALLAERNTSLVSKWALLSYPVAAMFDIEQAKCQGRLEEGGILLGAYRGPHLEISSFTTPGPNDLRRPYSFVKQDPTHQRSATKVWKRSGGKDTYVGEWHTHPFGRPEPSAIDKQSWRTTTVAAQRTMIFAIVAPLGWRIFWCEPKWWRIAIAPMNIVERGQAGIVLRPKGGLFRQ